MTMDGLRDQLRESAAKNVKTNLVITAISKAENVEVTDEDIEEEYKKFAEMYNMELDKVKEIMKGNEESMKGDIIARKTVDIIVGAAKEGKAKKTAKKAAASADEKKPAKKTTTRKTTKKAEAADDEKAEKPAKKTATRKKTAAKKTEE